jgi:predicted TIM-barrel fold metal-dependent hydrolase
MTNTYAARSHSAWFGRTLDALQRRQPAIAALLKLVPVSQVTYGTDWPYFGLDQNKDLHKLGLPTADIAAIESGNATRLIPRLKAA